MAFDRANATKQASTPNKFGYRHPITYASHLFHTVLTAQSAAWMVDDDIRQRTILIDTGAIRTTKFTLTDEDKQLLYGNGRLAAESFFKNE